MENPISREDVEEVATGSASAKPLALWLLAVLALAVDELNPVKVLCSYTGESLLHMRERHVAMITAAFLCWLMYEKRRKVLYYACRLFFRCTFNNMFFRSVEIVGVENLPVHGPVILTGNHNNQFVDGIFLLTNSHREISFMIAQKSWERPFVGFLARAFNCIPVSRPQDVAFAGAGKVVADGSDVLRGVGTRFTKELEPGSQLEIKGHNKPCKVKAIISDTELQLDSEATAQEADGEKYKVFPKIDQSKMYDAVYRALKKGKCLGIFPEGGSHDRTDLLPLKAGVAIIALDAHSKHSIRVPVVPVGLNYFKGHRFGGRVVVEFGSPIHIPESIYVQAEQDKRGATDALLQIITTGMRSVIVPTPDYSYLQQIYMVRRLYMREGVKVTTEKAMDLNRRFAIGVHRIMQLASGNEVVIPPSPNGDPQQAVAHDTKLLPEELKEFNDLHKELEEYMSDLKGLGLRDHQVRQIGWWSFKDLVSQLIYLLVTVGLGAIPNVLFNLPVMAISSRLAVIEQDKSLKASSVKLAARDVVMSYKIIYVLIMIPMIYVFYGTLLVLLTPWCTTSIVLVLLSLPSFAFLGMKAAEQGVRTYTDVVPLFRRLLPGNAEKYEKLPGRRAALQRRLYQAVKTFGPRLGDLYYAKEVNWSKEMSLEAPSLTPSASFNLKHPEAAQLADPPVTEATDSASNDDTSLRRRAS